MSRPNHKPERRSGGKVSALALFTGHLPQLLAATLLEVIIRLIALSPLLMLVTREMPWAALLAPVLYVLLVFPARQNAAVAMQQLCEEGEFSLLTLVNPSGYFRKLKQGCKAMLPLLLWFLPFLAATGALVFIYKAPTIEGVTDVFTLVRGLITLGDGSTMTGVVRVAMIYAATLIPGFIGLGWHCGLRHAYATGRDRRLLRHRRIGLLLNWVLSALVFVPFGAVAVLAARDYVQRLFEALSNLMGGIVIPAPDANLLIIAAAAVLLLFPAVPLHSLLTACRVHRLAEKERKW